MTVSLLVLLLLAALAAPARAWNQAQFELYDLVEEVGQNFYSVLEVEQDASDADIRRAFRVQSVKVHPDKSDDPDAERKFRLLVAVAEALKDPELRAMYNNVLENGLPNWRQPIYYVRVSTKLSLFQVACMLFIFSCISHYLSLWGLYFERYYVWTQAAAARARKKKDVEPFIAAKPHLRDLYVVGVVKALPSFARHLVAVIQHRLQKPEDEDLHEDDYLSVSEDRRTRFAADANADTARFDYGSIVVRGDPNNPQPADGDTATLLDAAALQEQEEAKADAAEMSDKGRVTGAWTDAEKAHLVQLMKKFPGGLPDRWGRIAEELNRDEKDVTKQAQALRQGIGLPRAKTSAPSAPASAAPPASEPTPSNYFTSEQQRALEAALRTYTQKTPDRWDLVAAQVPGKTKEECIARVRELVQRTKQKATT